jgi:hypothetical protein
MVNQSKLRPYKTCKKYMYGFKIPLGYEDAIRLDKLHGNNKWQSATKLEMDQLHEYDTFSTIPSVTKVLEQLLRRSSRRSEEDFKKIRVDLVYACKHRILSCAVCWGVTILPYVDKWTRVHFIG